MKTTEILKQYFGYNNFRPGQEELINSILQGVDCLGVMPTGAGKSLCFQVPALLLPGITLVVSPLISLMKDQVNALTQSGVKAAFLNSSLTERQYYAAINNAKAGAYKIIYVAPERLESPEFSSFVQNSNISMVTIDEAHCISHWGQDFRPSYLKIAEFVNSLQKRPVVSAFTATATRQVRDDIILHLGLNNPKILVTGFDRKNLFFKIEQPPKKKTALLAFVQEKKSQSGIVYCATRKSVEDVCDFLNKNGYGTSRYHAGLSDKERHNNQEDFLHDKVQIMVATNAFGMGIDKSNVNFVVHYNVPKNIESYYQEAGRAGRDGEPATCLLLYSGQDIRTQLFMIENEERDEHLKELDRKRLKEMSLYSQSYTCLRGYILKYFGETAVENCGNCSNCLSQFEDADITIEAQKILSCVIKSGERYGVVTIIDALRGSKNEKILRFGLQNLSTYNISSLSEKSLRDIVNFLVTNKYLYVTDEKFPILKRGIRYSEILQKGASIKMKIEKLQIDNKTSTQEAKLPNPEMFNILKGLRKEIADEQKVPAFVVFSDSTLIDMCRILPQTPEDFLKVTGVGEVKLQRFGERFMAKIADQSPFHKEVSNHT